MICEQRPICLEGSDPVLTCRPTPSSRSRQPRPSRSPSLAAETPPLRDRGCGRDVLNEARRCRDHRRLSRRERSRRGCGRSRARPDSPRCPVHGDRGPMSPVAARSDLVVTNVSADQASPKRVIHISVHISSEQTGAQPDDRKAARSQRSASGMRDGDGHGRRRGCEHRWARTACEPLAWNRPHLDTEYRVSLTIVVHRPEVVLANATMGSGGLSDSVNRAVNGRRSTRRAVADRFSVRHSSHDGRSWPSVRRRKVPSQVMARDRGATERRSRRAHRRRC